MTVKQLMNLDIKDVIKKRVIEVAEYNYEMNRTPICRSIDLTLKAYLGNTINNLHSYQH